MTRFSSRKDPSKDSTLDLQTRVRGLGGILVSEGTYQYRRWRKEPDLEKSGTVLETGPREGRDRRDR